MRRQPTPITMIPTVILLATPGLTGCARRHPPTAPPPSTAESATLTPSTMSRTLSRFPTITAVRVVVAGPVVSVWPRKRRRHQDRRFACRPPDSGTGELRHLGKGRGVAVSPVRW